MRTHEVLCLAALMMASVCGRGAPVHEQVLCQLISFKGHVAAGEEFSRPLSADLVFVLNPTETGWEMAIEGPDPTASMGTADYMGIATPPYHSNSTPMIEASYSNTVQQAVKFSPREFHFALNEEQFREIRKTVDTALYAGQGVSAAEREKAEDFVNNRLYEITGNGKLSISGFRLGKVKGGETDAIVAMSFEVELHVPASFATTGESTADVSGCSR